MAWTNITVGIDAASRPRTSDFPHPDLEGYRVITLAWDNLTIHLPANDDAALVDITGDLIDRLGRLRYAALDRIEHQPQPSRTDDPYPLLSDTPMGIEDDIAGEAVAS